MPLRIHGRDALLDALTTTLTSTDPGAACLVGARGSGRTTVLEMLAERLGRPVRRVSGARSEGTITRQLGFDADGITAYTRIPGELRAEGTVVLVDDADQFDRAAAVLLTQLARAGVPLLVAVLDVHHLPGPLGDEAARSPWPLHRLDRLADDAVLSLAADLVGEDLSAESSAFLLDRADGNPGIAVEILRSAAAGLRHTPAGVEIGQPGLTPHLVELHEPMIRTLDTVDHGWLVRLSLAEQLPVAMVPPVVLDHLLVAGLATRADDRIAIAGRLLADVVRDGLEVSNWQLACASLAEDLASHGPSWTALASLLRVRAGDALPCDQALAAARRAVNAHRWTEASDLLAGIDPATVTADDEPVLALLRGAALSGAGEHEAANRHLHAAIEDPQVSAAVLVRVGAELGLLHAVRRTDPAEAVRVVGQVADRLTGADRAALDADLVKWHLMAGLEPPPVPGAGHAADVAGQVGVLVISAMVESLDGRPAAARGHVAEGLALLASEEGLDQSANSAHLLGLSHYLSLAFDGHVDAAEDWAVSRRDLAARTADPALGMWEYAAGELGLHAGRLEWADTMTSRAIRHLAWQDFTGLRLTALALDAALDARRGDLDSALRSVADLPEGAGADVKVDLHVARVHAERHRLAGHLDRASAVLTAAGHRAIAESHRHLGVLAIDEAWMLQPEESLAAVLSEHSSTSPLAAAFATRAQSWAARDAAAMEDAARSLAAGGFLSRAVHAWAQAGTLHGEAGQDEAATAARRTAALLVAHSGCSSWPGDGDPAALTARELEIARLVAVRVRSREIAVRLGLSVRTVDNHVGRILRKLGVSRRSEVEHVFRSVESRSR